MLEVRGLRRSYGDLVALDDVSFDVPRGQIVGFVGRNGAGKTTTMRVIMGLVRPHAGEVRWDGDPIDHPVRQRFGYLPEERGLYPKMRVRDQLVYLARLSGIDEPTAAGNADRLIQLLGLTERADGPVDDLSLGNQQRVQLAAALVHGPEVLILDEPFSGLDPVGVDVMAETLRSEADRGAAVVFSSHQLELIERLCDDVVIIDAGRIVHDRDAVSDAGTVRVIVRLVDAADDWFAGVEGVTLIEQTDHQWLFELQAATDPGPLAQAAATSGSLRGFQVGTRSLADRFREVIDR